MEKEMTFTHIFIEQLELPIEIGPIYFIVGTKEPLGGWGAGGGEEVFILLNPHLDLYLTLSRNPILTPCFEPTTSLLKISPNSALALENA